MKQEEWESENLPKALAFITNCICAWAFQNFPFGDVKKKTRSQDLVRSCFDVYILFFEVSNWCRKLFFLLSLSREQHRVRHYFLSTLHINVNDSTQKWISRFSNSRPSCICTHHPHINIHTRVDDWNVSQQEKNNTELGTAWWWWKSWIIDKCRVLEGREMQNWREDREINKEGKAKKILNCNHVPRFHPSRQACYLHTNRHYSFGSLFIPS